VTAVQNFGGGDILEIADGRKDVLIPFTKAAVPDDRRCHAAIVASIRSPPGWSTMKTSEIDGGPPEQTKSPEAFEKARPRGPEGCGRQPRCGNLSTCRDGHRMSHDFRATVLTLYPEMFPGALGLSLAGKALERARGRSRRCRSATSPPTGIARSTTRRPAAARAW
jgi:hypothetical protein